MTTLRSFIHAATLIEYPVTQRFSSRRISPLLVALTFGAFVGLAVFNLVTQGRDLVYTTVISSNYQSSNGGAKSNGSCQPAAMSVGDYLFTNSPPGDPTGPLPGGFQWSIGSVANSSDGAAGTATGFQYEGDPMTCNLTSIGLTYRYQMQSFVYGICADCKMRVAESKHGELNYVTLCTNYDLSTANLPGFTKVVQQQVQNRIYGLAATYPNMSWPASTFPGIVYPNYNQPNNPMALQPISTAQIVQLSSWIANITYVPNPDPVPPPSKDPALANGTMYPMKQATPMDFTSAYLATSASSVNSSGLQLAIVGIGGIQPLWQPGAPASWPAPLPAMFSYLTTSLAMMMDLAGKDVNNRSIATNYLCTVTSRKWKKPWSLLAMIIGNTIGVITGIFTVMIFVAKHYDKRIVEPRMRERSSRVASEVSLPDKGSLNGDSVDLEKDGNGPRPGMGHDRTLSEASYHDRFDFEDTLSSGRPLLNNQETATQPADFGIVSTSSAPPPSTGIVRRSGSIHSKRHFRDRSESSAGKDSISTIRTTGQRTDSTGTPVQLTISPTPATSTTFTPATTTADDERGGLVASPTSPPISGLSMTPTMMLDIVEGPSRRSSVHRPAAGQTKE